MEDDQPVDYGEDMNNDQIFKDAIPENEISPILGPFDENSGKKEVVNSKHQEILKELKNNFQNQSVDIEKAAETLN